MFTKHFEILKHQIREQSQDETNHKPGVKINIQEGSTGKKVAHKNSHEALFHFIS